MGDLLIRDVPDELKDDLGKIAEGAGRSMSDIAKDLIRTGLENHQSPTQASPINAYEQLRALFQPEDDEDDAFSRIMDEIEDDRRSGTAPSARLKG